MITRADIPRTRRWVVKIGSALLTAEGAGLDRQALGGWVDQLADWLQPGHELVLVSSGAVAEGMCRMGWDKRPDTLHELQAAAAIGQMGLVQAWESCFQRRGRHTAQVLVTHDDLSDRKRYLNARSTLQTLISLGVVPVVNENDVVANDELRFGDNDTLAALVANLVEAELLVLLTDQDGLFDADPRSNPNARLIEHAQVDDPSLDRYAGSSKGALGSGGMHTKLRAARLAARSGTATIIASGKQPDALCNIAAGQELGSLLVPTQEPDAARKRWLAGQLQARGRLSLDAGAVRMLRKSGSSLLAVGVTRVEGHFSRGEMVVCLGPDGREVARGLVNYSAEESRRIAGKASSRFEEILGYMDDEELIHRDNLVVL
ncbi:glutamate 5-kinase [Thiolapillus sp.]